MIDVEKEQEGKSAVHQETHTSSKTKQLSHAKIDKSQNIKVLPLQVEVRCHMSFEKKKTIKVMKFRSLIKLSLKGYNLY